MGVVYRARDTRLDREVALKVLADGLSADADAVRRFEQEARAASALKVAYLGLAGGEPNVYVQYLNGGPPVNLSGALDLPLQTRTVVGGSDVLPDADLGCVIEDAEPDFTGVDQAFPAQ